MDAATLKEHLATLNVSEDCSDEAFTQAYRDLVKIWHPDRFAHDERLRLKAEEQLKLINHAYDSLRNYRRETSDARSRPSPDSSQASGSEPPRDVVFCAHCGVSLRVPEGATYLRCPSCKHEQDRNGAPRPQRPPVPPDDAPVDDTRETEMPLATPNHPFAAPFVGLLAVVAVLLVLSFALTRVESTKSVEQSVDPSQIESLLEFAGAGYASAQFNLGDAYNYGQGVPQDYTKAVAWYRQAAEQGLADAQINLGVMYQLGHGVPQDDAQAAAWYRKAAEQGRAVAQWLLGLAYQIGQGVPKDYVESHKWLNLAASRAAAEYQKEYAEARDAVAKLMTPAQLAEAQQRASAWLAAFHKRGGK